MNGNVPAASNDGLTVALVTSAWRDDDTGGATFEEELLRGALAQQSKHRLLVYPDSARARLAARDAGALERTTFLPALAEPALPGRVLQRLLRTARLRPPFIPYAPLNRALRDAGAQAAWMLGGSLVPLDIPYLATLWDLGHRAAPWFPEVSANGEWRDRERFYTEYLRRASAVLVGTVAGANEVRAAYGEPAGGLHVLPLPTPAFALAAADAPVPPRPPGTPERFLLYPAQFWPHKNHVTAVRALAVLRERRPDAPDLVFVGSDRGTRKHVLAVARELGLADHVHLPGFVSREQLVSLYRHADALLYPSLLGPDNLPPLEAMALGCPAIVARVPGAEEQLGDAALLVDGLDPIACADAVDSLADRTRRGALIARGRLRAARWTTADYAHAALQLIDERIVPVRGLWGA